MKLARVALVAVLALSSTVHAYTVTKTTTFNPGLLWTSFTYSYLVTKGPLDGPYNDIHISFGDISQISGGPAPVPGGPTPGTKSFFAPIAQPGGFPPAATFTVESKTNPTFVEGKQNIQITFQGGVVGNAVAALPSVNLGLTAGALAVAFAPGTFASLASVDLFQNDHGLAQLGSGTAASDGSATISLLHSLNASPLFVGQQGALAFDAAVVAEASTLVLLLTGGLLIAIAKGRKKLID
jgi:hypothetical protein